MLNLPGPHVVLLSADEVELALWSEALVGAAEVRVVRDLSAFAVALAEGPADVVIAPCQATLLEGIQKHRGDARLILCGLTLPEGIIDAAGQGYDLRHVERPEGLRREVHALARPRSLMVRHALPGLSVRWAGALRQAPLMDISNGGFSFRFELDDELERLLPGTLLTAVEIFRGPSLAMSVEAALVRYVEQIAPPGEPAYYRLGCELAPAVTAPVNGGRQLRLTDGAARAGLLRAALRTGGIFLQGQEGLASGVLCPAGHVDLERGELSLEAQLVPFAPFDVVRGTFELGGGSYSFVTSTMSISPLRLRLPPAIEGTHRRSSARFRPDPRSPISVELLSPLLPGGPLRRNALELSSTGFSFVLDAESDLFPPGMWLTQIELRLGELSLRCTGQVKNIAPMSGPQGTLGTLRCGVVFDGLDAEARAGLADAVMRNRYVGLADGSELSFDELWKFFEDTRFLYPEKAAALAPYLPEVRQTFLALHARPSRIFKSFIYREGGVPLAHGSCVRVYRRTWLLQHLAGTTRRHGRQAPQILNTGLAEYFGQITDFEYCKFFFRPDNKWPSRVFGGFARKVSDKQLSDLRTYEYVAMPTDCILPGAGSVRVVEAGPSDLRFVEGHLVARERGLLLRSDDLTRASINLDELQESYRRMGLSRRRTVLLALRGDEPAGYALCEVSSPGLNLSELLSAVRLAVLPLPGLSPQEQAARDLEVRTALLRAALQVYRKAGRPLAVVLLPEGDEGALALPAVSRKRYTCWTVHRTLYRRFCEHIDRVYELLNSGRRKKEQAQDGVPDGELVRGDAA